VTRREQRLEAKPVQTRPERVQLSVTTVLLLWLLKRLFRLLWWVIRRPLILLVAALVYGAVRLVTWTGPGPPGSATTRFSCRGWPRSAPRSLSTG
jgi:hypothetical protein